MTFIKSSDTVTLIHDLKSSPDKTIESDGPSARAGWEKRKIMNLAGLIDAFKRQRQMCGISAPWHQSSEISSGHKNGTVC